MWLTGRKLAKKCHFLCLEPKKVTKENSRLQIILGLLFFRLPTQYNSLVALAQTVLLTAGPRSKLQNSRFFPKFSEAVWNPFLKKHLFLSSESHLQSTLLVLSLQAKRGNLKQPSTVPTYCHCTALWRCMVLQSWPWGRFRVERFAFRSLRYRIQDKRAAFFSNELIMV